MTSNIMRARQEYKPFEYPAAFEFYLAQRRAHWSTDEIAMSKDIQDWNNNLLESERLVLGQILKSFVQTETHVNEYWSQKVVKWFPKYEIVMMATTFASFEAIHTEAYAYLNDSLGLTDYSAFLQDETAVAKLNRLQEVSGRSKRDIARSLAIFSAFTEGVNLFSSFSILMNLSRAPWNMLKGLNNIVSWSVRDESLHSQAGCWLFNQLIKENPDIWDDELKKDVYDAARLTVKLEDDFIDNAFSLGEIRGLDPKDLKNFIRMRANAKLKDLGLKTNWTNIDKESLDRMEWFDEKVNGRVLRDFFDTKVSEYEKCNFTLDNMFGDT